MSRTVCIVCRQHHRERTRHLCFTVVLVTWLIIAGLLLIAVFWVES